MARRATPRNPGRAAGPPALGIMGPVPNIAVVLGAGGLTGQAFHTGVLTGILDATGWDVRDADQIGRASCRERV